MATQTKLFESDGLTTGFRDSAFVRNKELPLHRWVPWIAGFSADFVDDCLSNYLNPRPRKHSWVMDPFAGVGTTLLQSYVRGHNVIGFEINPYAALAASLKLEAISVSRRRFESQMKKFHRFMGIRCANGTNGNRSPHSSPPEGFNGRTQFFSSKVERKVLFVLDFVNSIEEPRIRDLFRLALGSVMVKASNYSYEPSLTRRTAVGKAPIVDYDVEQLISLKLGAMLEDVKWLQRTVRSLDYVPHFELHSGSILQSEKFVSRRNFIDLVITSPPYMNNYHYPRNTRPQVHWLGLATGRGYEGSRESESFGKFWQTVRARPPIPLKFGHRTLERTIDAISQRNTEKGDYGGCGWANYGATYFNDAFDFCLILKKLLRRGGKAVIVLGNSVIQGVEVKTDKFFGEIAELCGLRFSENIMLRKKRTGTSIIQSAVRTDKANIKTVLYESAIILEN